MCIWVERSACHEGWSIFYAPINVKPHYHIYGLRLGKVGICTLVKYKSPPTAPTMKCLHFVKNDRRDCILVSCNMYNNQSPLSERGLMVDSPIIPHPQSVYVVVGLYILRFILKISKNFFTSRYGVV